MYLEELLMCPQILDDWSFSFIKFQLPRSSSSVVGEKSWNGKITWSGGENDGLVKNSNHVITIHLTIFYACLASAFHLAEYVIKTIPAGRDNLFVRAFLSFSSHDFVHTIQQSLHARIFFAITPFTTPLYRYLHTLAVTRLVAMASSANRVWCTSCNAFRSSEDFLTLNSGKPRKTCSKHLKKRDLDTSLDSWDVLLAELREWNYPVCQSQFFNALLCVA